MLLPPRTWPTLRTLSIVAWPCSRFFTASIDYHGAIRWLDGFGQGQVHFNGTVKEYTPYLQNELKCTLPEHEFLRAASDALNPVIAQSSNVKIGLKRA